MADLRRTPSVQHAVALIRDTIDATVREMEKLDAARIPFSLNPGRRLIKPLMEGRPLEWAVRQLRLDKRRKNIEPNIGLISAFSPYAQSKKLNWFRACEFHAYPIGSGIVIPVRPAGYWVENGILKVLWPQCWKGRTLDKRQKAIFHSILRESFFVGDFKDAALEWVDLREIAPGKGRDLEIIPAEELGSITHDDLRGYLDILIQAFKIHSAMKEKRKETQASSEVREGDQLPLFNWGLEKLSD